MFKKLIYWLLPLVVIALVALYSSVFQWHSTSVEFEDSGFLTNITNDKVAKKELFKEMNSYTVEFENKFLGKRTEIAYADSIEKVKDKISNIDFHGNDITCWLAIMFILICLVAIIVSGRDRIFDSEEVTTIYSGYILLTNAAAIIYVSNIPSLVFL